MTTATAEFDLDSWDEQTLDEAPGARLFSIEITKTYRGDVEGTSVTRLFTATSDTDEGSAAYGGVERLDVSVLGKKGTFVLRHAALMSPAGQGMEVLVVPNTGTGELAGITGSAQIDVGPGGEHAFTIQLD
jgi:hypothetical protein